LAVESNIPAILGTFETIGPDPERFVLLVGVFVERLTSLKAIGSRDAEEEEEDDSDGTDPTPRKRSSNCPNRCRNTT